MADAVGITKIKDIAGKFVRTEYPKTSKLLDGTAGITGRSFTAATKYSGKALLGTLGLGATTLKSLGQGLTFKGWNQAETSHQNRLRVINQSQQRAETEKAAQNLAGNTKQQNVAALGKEIGRVQFEEYLKRTANGAKQGTYPTVEEAKAILSTKPQGVALLAAGKKQHNLMLPRVLRNEMNIRVADALERHGLPSQRGIQAMEKIDKVVGRYYSESGRPTSVLKERGVPTSAVKNPFINFLRSVDSGVKTYGTGKTQFLTGGDIKDPNKLQAEIEKIYLGAKRKADHDTKMRNSNPTSRADQIRVIKHFQDVNQKDEAEYQRAKFNKMNNPVGLSSGAAFDYENWVKRNESVRLMEEELKELKKVKNPPDKNSHKKQIDGLNTKITQGKSMQAIGLNNLKNYSRKDLRAPVKTSFSAPSVIGRAGMSFGLGVTAYHGFNQYGELKQAKAQTQHLRNELIKYELGKGGHTSREGNQLRKEIENAELQEKQSFNALLTNAGMTVGMYAPSVLASSSEFMASSAKAAGNLGKASRLVKYADRFKIAGKFLGPLALGLTAYSYFGTKESLAQQRNAIVNDTSMDEEEKELLLEQISTQERLNNQNSGAAVVSSVLAMAGGVPGQAIAGLITAGSMLNEAQKRTEMEIAGSLGSAEKGNKYLRKKKNDKGDKITSQIEDLNRFRNREGFGGLSIDSNVTKQFARSSEEDRKKYDYGKTQVQKAASRSVITPNLLGALDSELQQKIKSNHEEPDNDKMVEKGLAYAQYVPKFVSDGGSITEMQSSLISGKELAQTGLHNVMRDTWFTPFMENNQNRGARLASEYDPIMKEFLERNKNMQGEDSPAMVGDDKDSGEINFAIGNLYKAGLYGNFDPQNDWKNNASSPRKLSSFYRTLIRNASANLSPELAVSLLGHKYKGRQNFSVENKNLYDTNAKWENDMLKHKAKQGESDRKQNAKDAIIAQYFVNRVNSMAGAMRGTLSSKRITSKGMQSYADEYALESVSSHWQNHNDDFVKVATYQPQFKDNHYGPPQGDKRNPSARGIEIIDEAHENRKRNLNALWSANYTYFNAMAGLAVAPQQGVDAMQAMYSNFQKESINEVSPLFGDAQGITADGSDSLFFKRAIRLEKVIDKTPNPINAIYNEELTLVKNKVQARLAMQQEAKDKEENEKNTVPKDKTNSYAGYVPNFSAAREITGAKSLGASSSVKAINLGGNRWANNQETIISPKTFAAMGIPTVGNEPAIVPNYGTVGTARTNELASKISAASGGRVSFAASGFVPNFMADGSTKASATPMILRDGLTQAKASRGFVPNFMADGSTKASATPMILRDGLTQAKASPGFVPNFVGLLPVNTPRRAGRPVHHQTPAGPVAAAFAITSDDKSHRSSRMSSGITEAAKTAKTGSSILAALKSAAKVRDGLQIVHEAREAASGLRSATPLMARMITPAFLGITAFSYGQNLTSFQSRAEEIKNSQVLTGAEKEVQMNRIYLEDKLNNQNIVGSTLAITSAKIPVVGPYLSMALTGGVLLNDAQKQVEIEMADAAGLGELRTEALRIKKDEKNARIRKEIMEVNEFRLKNKFEGLITEPKVTEQLSRASSEDKKKYASNFGTTEMHKWVSRSVITPNLLNALGSEYQSKVKANHISPEGIVAGTVKAQYRPAFLKDSRSISDTQSALISGRELAANGQYNMLRDMWVNMGEDNSQRGSRLAAEYDPIMANFLAKNNNMMGEGAPAEVEGGSEIARKTNFAIRSLYNNGLYGNFDPVNQWVAEEKSGRLQEFYNEVISRAFENEQATANLPKNNYSGYVPNFFRGKNTALATEKAMGATAPAYFSAPFPHVRDLATQPNFSDVVRQHPEGLTQASANSKRYQESFTPNFAPTPAANSGNSDNSATEGNTQALAQLSASLSSLSEIIGAMKNASPAAQTTSSNSTFSGVVDLRFSGSVGSSNVDEAIADVQAKLQNMQRSALGMPINRA